MDHTINIGKNIREVRKEKGLSQQALAEKCGFSNTTLSSYENSKKTPRLTTIAVIARSLGVSIERLYYGDENTAFINQVSDDGRKIVNSVFLLWEKQVLYYNESGSRTAGMSQNYNPEGNAMTMFLKHVTPILRLLKRLDEFSVKKDTFTDPDTYLEILLSSVAAEINKEIEDEKRRAEQAENLRKAVVR